MPFVIGNGGYWRNPLANTLLATGGSGRERNLIYDPKDGIAGLEIKSKKSPLNDHGIRVMTPTEWGKLQGFVNYAFWMITGMKLLRFRKRCRMLKSISNLGIALRSRL